MTFDVGQNLTLLGLLYLFFKYLLPVIIGLILIIGAILFVRLLYTNVDLPINKNWLIVIVCFVLILLAVLIA